MREQDRDRKKQEWEHTQKQVEEHRTRDEENMRRQQESMQMRMSRQEEELRRRQQENNIFMQAQHLNSLLDQQEINVGGPGGNDGGNAIRKDDQGSRFNQNTGGGMCFFNVLT